MNGARCGLFACAIAVGAACASVFAQQARVQYTWTWSEVLANTATPSNSTPGVIDPTEGVRLTLHALMTPDVGQTVTYTPPPGSGSGTVHSWGGNETVIMGGLGAEGTYEFLSAALGFAPMSLTQLTALTANVGVESNWSLGQQPLSTANPVQGLLSVTWTPSVYSSRVVSFTSYSPSVSGFADGMLVQYGTGPTGSPLLTATRAIPDHGLGTGGIPIVPGPGGAAVIGLGMMMGRRGRGQMSKWAN